MATLTETAYYSRKTIKYGIISLVCFIIFRAVFIFALDEWKKAHPPPPPPANKCFGNIPAIKFPEKGTNPPFSPSRETVASQIPTPPYTFKVFLIPKLTSTFDTWKNAKNWAKKLGFTADPEEPDPYTYIFKTQSFPQTTLKRDVLTDNFFYGYDYQNDLTLVGKNNAPSKETAIRDAKAFLTQANVFVQDLVSGTQEIAFLKFVPPNLEPAISLSEADFTLVNFFRADLDGYKVLPPNPKKSLVSVLVSGDIDPQKKILETNYTHYLIKDSTFCTYPLKPLEQAWQELEKNQAYLANFGQNLDGQVKIRKIYLAYFDPPDHQPYLEPIYVFEGDRDFIAYISALDPNYTISNPQNSVSPTQ